MNSKKDSLFIGTVLITLIVVISLFYFNPFAQKVAFVSNNELFENYYGSKEVILNLESIKQKHKQDLDSIVARIKSEENIDIQKQLYTSFQKKVQDYKTEEENFSIKSNNELWLQINEFLSDYGKDNNYSIIYGANGNGSLMYADRTLDITKELIEYANMKYNDEQ